MSFSKYIKCLDYGGLVTWCKQHIQVYTCYHFKVILNYILVNNFMYC